MDPELIGRTSRHCIERKNKPSYRSSSPVREILLRGLRDRSRIRVQALSMSLVRDNKHIENQTRLLAMDEIARIASSQTGRADESMYALGNQKSTWFRPASFELTLQSFKLLTCLQYTVFFNRLICITHLERQRLQLQCFLKGEIVCNLPFN